MHLIKRDPFISIFEDVFGSRGLLNTDGALDLSPAVDVIEKDTEWVFYFDLPGVDKKNINIEIDEDYLVVSGKRDSKKEERKDGYVYSERRCGSFQRRFTLPGNIDTKKISASSENGVLQVTIGKITQVHSKKITLQPN